MLLLDTGFIRSIAFIVFVNAQSIQTSHNIEKADASSGPALVTHRLQPQRTLSDPLLGAGQGVAYHDGNLYIYGDRYKPTPRRGVIREYSANGDFTGREIDCGPAPFHHPTGLTWSDHHGCFLGFTVKRAAGEWREPTAIILQIDWPRALADGHLRNAILQLYSSRQFQIRVLVGHMSNRLATQQCFGVGRHLF